MMGVLEVTSENYPPLSKKEALVLLFIKTKRATFFMYSFLLNEDDQFVSYILL